MNSEYVIIKGINTKIKQPLLTIDGTYITEGKAKLADTVSRFNSSNSFHFKVKISRINSK